MKDTQPILRRTGLALLSCALLAAVSTLATKAQAEDVKIGVIVPTTGALAPLGIDMRNGYEQAVKDAPTVKGQKVRLLVEDEQATAAVGLSKAQKLVLQDHVKILVGGASSATVLAISAQGPRLGVPMLTTNSQAVQTTGAQCSRLMFRTNPNDAMQANGNALLMKSHPELLKKKWFIIYHDFVWGQSNKAQFEKIPGLNVVGSAGRSMGTADWSSAISQIQSSGADAIYLALAVGDDMPAFIKQARSFGLKQFMLPPLGMPDSMLQALGDDAVGLITGGLFGSWMTEDQNPEMAKFVKEYATNYGMVPGPQAIQAYAGMRLVLAAMDGAKSLDTNGIVDALDNTSVDTVIGKLAVRKGDHQGMVGTYEAQAVKLPQPKYGAKYAWKVDKVLSWDEVKVPLAETGCKGL
jgi:ABC-type branched-subunit amino acid transport system substrate-binding protein